MEIYGSWCALFLLLSLLRLQMLQQSNWIKIEQTSMRKRFEILFSSLNAISVIKAENLRIITKNIIKAVWINGGITSCWNEIKVLLNTSCKVFDKFWSFYKKVSEAFWSFYRKAWNLVKFWQIFEAITRKLETL